MGQFTEIDTKGLLCPLPVLKAKKAIKALASGELICILATDPASTRDIPAFCRRAGHTLERSREADGVYSFLIRKAGGELRQAS